MTWEGRPLAKGVILFDPVSDAAGTAVGAMIRGGRYAIPRHEGPVPGTYRVRIYASSGVQAVPTNRASARAPRPMVELIPDRYNTRSTLTADITPRGTATFRFRLTSDAPSPGAR